MDVPVSDAKAQLTELVRRAEAGEEVVLTRHGHRAVRLEPVEKRVTAAERRKALEEFWGCGVGKPGFDVPAERSQDFLYDEFGLPF